MERVRRIHGERSVRTIAALLICLLCSACDPGQLPTDTSLGVQPTSRSIRVHVMRDDQGLCLIDPTNYLDIPVQVSLTRAGGDPLAGEDLMAFMDFSAQTYARAAAVTLLLDGAPPEVMDANNAMLFDIEAGSRVLMLRVNLSCPFRGEFTVLHETRSAGMSVEVIEVNQSP